jgi:hypothetical protein
MKSPHVWPVLDWHAQAQFIGIANRDSLKLAIAVSAVGSGWQVVAIVTKEDIRTTEELFDDHSHKVVGNYPSPAQAFEAAESFAGAWLKDSASTRAAEKCACDELPAPRVPETAPTLDQAARGGTG